ncbi:MAG: site-specific DNA-methyltransferase [Ignavibacteria bacterium]|nr:site-specific DNA-methyltransferase [Ignavibacteria bacterium]
MIKLLDELKNVLCQREDLIIDNSIAKNKIIELALKDDSDLIKLLLTNDLIKNHFFLDVDGVLIFLKDKFIKFISTKAFLPDSYTAFKNKIGLIDEKGEFISEKKEVVLSWPYKDCVLEGGMTKEDQKRDEIFWNEILAPDEISRLLDPKVFTNAKRINEKGEHKFDGFKTDEKGDIKDNLIIKGNNLLVLHSLKKRFAGKVKLIYIDPPFNTGNDSFNYNDRFNHSSWLTFMKNRLEIARNMLSTDGNIFIHIDINESHYLKTLCDEIFDRNNFVEEIIWSYGSPSGGRAAGAKPVNIHNYILHYAKNYKNRKQNKVFTPYSEKYIEDWFKFTDKDGRRYQRRMRGRDEKGNIIWEKQYLDESKGVPLTTVWDDIKQVYADPRAYKENQAKYTELIREFSGQKPEALIKRILDMASDEGDLVLDFFAGTGTTGAVAHKTKRQFILVEQMDEQVDILIKRLKKTIAGDQAGISREVNWQGGGDFVYLELMKWNENFADEIKKAKTKEELKKLWEIMKEKAFLSYKVDIKAIDEHAKDFDDLSIEDQKRFLYECLDKNHWYVNYTEIDDETYQVSEEDKKLNREFYGG